MMKKFLLVVFVLIGGIANAQVDDFTVANHKADPNTRIFDDNKHTVTGYVYSVIEKKTSCCGNAAIYIEVEINATGDVVSTKTLTGSHECFKKAIVDIIPTIKWNASGITGTKKVYFEVKPLIPCSGAPDENVYTPIFGDKPNPIAASKPVEIPVPKEVLPPVKEEIEEPIAVTTPPEKTIPPPSIIEEEEEEEEEEIIEEVKEVVAAVPQEPVAPPSKEDAEWLTKYDMPEEKPVTPPPAKEQPKPVPPVEKTKPAASITKPAEKPVTAQVIPSPKKEKPVAAGKASIPAQLKIEYVSAGDRKPDESHKESHKNYDPNKIGNLDLAGDPSKNSITVRKQLREAGICGLATGLVEVTVDPRGNVVSFNVVASNNEKVNAVLNAVAPSLKFVPQTGLRYNYVTYFQFKTDIMCEGEKRDPINLETVPDYLVGKSQ